MSEVSPVTMESSSSIKFDDVFHNKFYIPSKWLNNIHFKYLVEHRYATTQIVESFEAIEKALKNLGYQKANNQMPHDYLHCFVLDLLAHEGRPFVSEQEIRETPILQDLFKKGPNDYLTPDLIAKSGKTLSKPTIIDFYSGNNPKRNQEKSSKYKTIGYTFTHKVITPDNFHNELLDILDKPNIDYLYEQFQLFMAEYQYWQECLKFQRVLFFNNIENNPIIRELQQSEDFPAEQATFSANLTKKVKLLMEDCDL